MTPLLSPPKLRPGDRVAILSPSFAAPGLAPAVHEQGMRRFAELTGLEPVEYPTTRQLGASPAARAADVNAAFADPSIRAILATIGGEDQITVIRHLDPALPLADPKPFLGYSDNTHLHTWLWDLGLTSFYGGSTQVHWGSGPSVDAEQLSSLRAALFEGGILELTNPPMTEDFGVDWRDPKALSLTGDRDPSGPWQWAGPDRSVTGRTWGGCIEVLDEIGLAGRLPEADALEGTILLLETSEELPSATQVGAWVRALGERGYLEAVAGVMVARPPVSNFEHRPSPTARAALRQAQAETILEQVHHYHPGAVVCLGVPFGHTRPQWIVPHGGRVTLDGIRRTVLADYN